MSVYNGYWVSIKTLAVTSAFAALTIFTINWYNKRKRPVPQNWKPIGKVTDLLLYPLKSGRRIHLASAECTITGMKQVTEPGRYQLGDRILVVYKYSSKECRTARTNPKLVLVEVTVDVNDCLVINAPGMETLRLDISKILGKTEVGRREETITYWIEEKFRIIDCGEEAAQWITRYLISDGSSESRFGLHDGIYRRPINKTLQNFAKVYPDLTHDSMGIYTDLSSFLIMNQASVEELITRLPNTNVVSIHNFRPSIIVSDNNLQPYDEDKWEWIKIGGAVFKTVKACARCALTTVDPETGIRNKNFEPLKTLKSYRLCKDLIKTKCEENDPVMGVYMTSVVGGIINVGDTVSIPTEG